MRKRVLITGASGYLGGHLLLNKPPDVELFAMYHSVRPIEDFDAEWFQGDLLQDALPDQLIRDVKPDVVIHNAALSRPDECEGNHVVALELNVEATDRFAAALATRGSRLLFISTDMIFDGERAPYDEGAKPDPLLYYGTTKMLAELRVLGRSDLHVVARPSVIYGGKGIFGNNFAISMIEQWQRNQPAPVFIDQIRSHVPVTWLSTALWELAFGKFCGTIHLGGAEPSSRAEFAHALARHLGFPPELLHETSFVGKLPAPRPRDVTFDVSLANATLKHPPIPLQQGIALEWKQPRK